MPKLFKILFGMIIMVLLSTLAPMSVTIDNPGQDVHFALINGPPGDAITIIDQQTSMPYLINAQAANYQIARGVSVPVKELIVETRICSLYDTPIGISPKNGQLYLKPTSECGFLSSQDTYNFSGDLGLRWVPSA